MHLCNSLFFPPRTLAYPVAQPQRMLVVGAFAVIYLVWGSTYLGIRWAVDGIPPLLMAGTRFLAAGALLLAIRRGPRFTRRDWAWALLLGGLMLGMGNGFVSVAEKDMPSGIAALLVATVPLWLAVMDAVATRRAPSALTWLGIALGLAGVAVLVQESGGWQSGSVQIWAVAGVLLGASAWALGSLLGRPQPIQQPFLRSIGLQMVCGGAILALSGLALGERPGDAILTTQNVGSWAYLVVFGSILAFTAYSWLLRHVEPAKVGTYAFVNPVVAVALGALLAHEPLTAKTGGAAILVALAVAVTLIGRVRAGRKTSLAGPATGADAND